jgi:hypothetical protein
VTTLRLRAEAVRWREIDQEVVAVDLNNSVYLSANESGRLLWRRLESGATVDELVVELVAAFGIDRQPARVDVETFVAALDARDLLERS